MKYRLVPAFLFILFSNLLPAQEKIEWTPNEVITESSFQGTVPDLSKDNLQQYVFMCTWEFGFQMANMQFAFTKNFNKYVEAYYNPQLSWMESGNRTDQLLLMANLEFDMAELYARKFRKELYENKSVASSVNFFNELHNQINVEYNNHQAIIQSRILTEEDPGPYLEEEVASVNQQIEELAEFCKTCKPKKKRKKR